MIDTFRIVLKDTKLMLVAFYSFFICFEYIYWAFIGADSILKPYRVIGILIITYTILNAVHQKNFKFDSYDFLLIIFFLIFYLSAISTAGIDGSDMGFTHSNSILIVFSFLICLCIKQIFPNDINVLKLVIFLFMLGTFLNVLYAIISVVSNPLNAFRISGFYKDPAIFGVTVTILLSYCISQYLFIENNPKLKILIIFVAFISFSVLLLSASRTGLLSLFVMIAAVGIIKLGFIKSIIILLSILLSILFVVNIDFTNLPPDLYRIGITFERLSLDSTLNGGGAGRLPTWRAAFDLFQDNYFFGIGMGQYPEYSIQYAQLLPEGVENTVVYENKLGMHSNYMSALVEAGFIGFLAYTLLNFLWLCNVVKSYFYAKNENSLFFLLLFITLSMAGFTQETFTFPYYLFFLTLLTIHNKIILNGELKI
jgi:O-antigen ligase|tara:strand:+ start:19786 stop:21060 length:1275 start_codon:yes stop_codon:yes gene_type:complete